MKKLSTILGIILLGMIFTVKEGKANDFFFPPQDFSLEQIGYDSIMTIWTHEIVDSAKPPYDNVSHWDLYFAEGETKDLDQFKRLNYLIEDYTFKKDGKNWFSCLLNNLELNGTYSFYLTAAGTRNEFSDPSNIVTANLVWHEPAHIDFTNIDEVKHEFVVGEEFQQDFDAEASNDDELSYFLVEEEEGMSIDKSTGMFKWECDIKGYYKVQIGAQSAQNPDLQKYYQYVIQIVECENPVIIAGTITNDLGEPCLWGTMGLFLDKTDSLHKYSAEQTFRFTDGQFSIKVFNPGKYYLYVQATEAEAEWYEDAKTMKEATPIVVECGDEKKEINIEVTHKIPKQKVIVSGHITRYPNGDPIPAGMVTFYPTKKSYPPTATFADSTGEFRLPLYNDVEYIARATGGFNKGNYLPLYYYDALNPDDATIININQKSQGIDFALRQYANYPNSVSGTVVNKDLENIDYSVVTLYKLVDKDEWDFEFERMFYADTTGFKFESLMPGKYILFAYTTDEYIPGLYVEGDFACKTLEDATILEIEEETKLSSIVIKLQSRSGGGGFAVIQGQVRIGNGTITNAKSSKTQSDNDIVRGANIYIENAVNNTKLYCSSDDYGNYDISELKPGIYHVTIVKPGYEPYEFDITINDEHQTIDQDIVLVPKTIGISDVVVNSDSQVFPNPASDKITISTTMSGELNVKIYSVLGQLTLSRSANTGNGQLSLENLDLQNGNYILTISNGSTIHAMPLQISK